jgi:hypothetical protein
MHLKHWLLVPIVGTSSAAAVDLEADTLEVEAEASRLSRRDLDAYERTHAVLNPAVHALHISIDAITSSNVADQVQDVKAKARILTTSPLSRQLSSSKAHS